MADELSQLKQMVEGLQKEVTRLSDQEEVRKLQYKYGYYLDKCLYKEVADLFSDSPDAYVQFLGGRYHGKEGIKRLYVTRFGTRFVNRNGPVHGFLLDHPQMQGIVDIFPPSSSSSPSSSPPHTTAKARFRSLMQAGVHASQSAHHPRGVAQWWEGGIYENEYIKDGPENQWRIFRLRYFPFWHADFEHGWAYKVSGFVPFLSKTFPEDPSGPDVVIEEEQRMLWPDTRVVPFHYGHPVTGEEVEEGDLRAPVFGGRTEDAKPALRLEP